jgi:hypothetical protein
VLGKINYLDLLVDLNLSAFGKLYICLVSDVFRGDLLICSPLAIIIDITIKNYKNILKYV